MKPAQEQCDRITDSPGMTEKLLEDVTVNSFLASSKFCHLPITFANSLDPDQDRQNISPDLDPNQLAL